MKKTIVLIALTLISKTFLAQDLTSKKGEIILPEQGDWSVGIDASPFLNYAGNFFGKTNSNTSPNFNFITKDQTLTGKYFKDAQTAYRVGLRIGLNSQATRKTVTERAAVPTSTNYPSAVVLTENSWRRSNSALGLSAGIEKRKGKTRLHGIYGAEVGFYVSASRDRFSYGNALIPTGTTPVFVDTIADAMTSATFGNANNVNGKPPIQGVDANGARIKERKNGITLSIGARAFVGVEYFILPKISLGGEFGWGIGFTTQGKSTTIWESTGSNAANTLPQTTTIEGAKQGKFALDTDNTNSIWGPSGTLRLNFYF
jgi:hypothetical protein